jgi:rod shape determining protein RodA
MSLLNEITLRRNPNYTLRSKLWQLNWALVLLVSAIALFGFAMLYSAAGGELSPWATRQALRFGLGLVLMIVIALIDIRLWFRFSYHIFGLVLLLLIAVEVMGTAHMGAQRWIDLRVIQLQPSELMKVALVLALARYFHTQSLEEIGRIRAVALPLVLVAAPAALVLKQPDLGTAVMLIAVAGTVFFAAGVRLWKFLLVILAAGGAVPVIWNLLHDYQRQRILTFLDPESDPLGAGYHILQSKIALGSGGMFGKGFLNGSQSHLNFLPEKQTDFIFTMLAEEFGMVGALGLLTLFVLLFAYGFAIALRSRNQFGRLLTMGLTTNLFFYVFINIAMVTGLIPVVGVPLPLISYGGTAMLATMVGFGLILSVSIHRDVMMPRRGPREELL